MTLAGPGCSVGTREVERVVRRMEVALPGEGQEGGIASPCRTDGDVWNWLPGWLHAGGGDRSAASCWSAAAGYRETLSP